MTERFFDILEYIVKITVIIGAIMWFAFNKNVISDFFISMI